MLRVREMGLNCVLLTNGVGVEARKLSVHPPPIHTGHVVSHVVAELGSAILVLCHSWVFGL